MRAMGIGLLPTCRSLVWVSLVGLAACGSASSQRSDGAAGSDGASGPFPPASGSGSRLKARTWVAEGGVRLPDTEGDARRQVWFDTKLGVPCVFEGSDAAMTCTPVAAFSDPSSNTGLPLLGFVDAACQGPRVCLGPQWPAGQAYRDAACTAGTRYVRLARAPDPNNPSASPLSDIFTLGAPLAVTTWYLQQFGDPSTCDAAPAPSGPGVFSVGRALAQTEFVAAHVERVDTGHRLSYMQIVADDGARERIGWYDATLGATCTLGPGRDQKLFCAPTVDPNPNDSMVLPGMFTDPACMTAAIYTVATAGFVSGPSSLQGSAPDSYYRVGPQATGLYQLAGGVCMKVGDNTGDGASHFRSVLDEVPLTGLDAFSEVLVGSGQLQIATWVDADGATEILSSSLSDTTAAAPCTLAPMADGKTRCLPPWNDTRYGDMSCTPASALISGVNTGYAGKWSGDECTGGYELFHVGAELPTPVDVYGADGTGNECFVIAQQSTMAAYSVGDEISPTTFAEAQLVTQ
jgi:hypothetical protein